MADGLEVRGGVGGTAARLEDLSAAAARLRAAGLELAGLGPRLLRVLADPALATGGPLCALSLAAAVGDLLAAAAGPHGVVTAGGQLTLLGCRLGAAALGYRLADRVAAEASRQADLAAGRLGAGAAVLGLGSVLGTLAFAGGTPVPGVMVVGAGLYAVRADPGAGSRFGAALLGRLGGHGDLAEHLVDAVPGAVQAALGAPAWAIGLPVPRDLPQTAALLAALVPALREPAAIRVRVGAPQPVPAPRDLAALAAGIDDCYPDPARGVRPGTVRVEAVTGADGRRAWIVEIPGTQSWSGVGTDPFDLTGDVHETAGHTSSARRTVIAAMRSAGVRPGEPVLLAGHSEGGMVAAGVAADPALRSQFRVTHVLTLGAPIANYPVPDGVQLLAVEHTDDLVPRLDGRPNPDRPGWVTVARRVTPPGSTVDLSRTHAAAGYGDTLRLVQASADPSVVAWRSGLGPFLGGPDRYAVAVDVSGSRVLPGSPG